MCARGEVAAGCHRADGARDLRRHHANENGPNGAILEPWRVLLECRLISIRSRLMSAGTLIGQDGGQVSDRRALSIASDGRLPYYIGDTIKY